METKISEKVLIWEKFNKYELYAPAPVTGYLNDSSEHLMARMHGYIPTRIQIKDAWYDVIPLFMLVRSKSEVDGAFHFIYIQINMTTKEYYIGKVNRKRWSEINRYKGSGLKFKNKYKGHEYEYIRYFIASCKTSEETEELEAKIVDEELLEDPKCLNLVCGGGGTSEHYDREKRAARQREIMEEHPEFYQSMVETAKKLYQSGDSFALQQRANAIKATMSDEHYRQLMSERIRRWRAENPEEYAKAREKNRLAMQKPEVKEKRNQTRKKWAKEHPEENKVLQEKLNVARNSPAARKKRAESLKKWNADHPEEAKANAEKRSAASVAKCRRAVNMCDLETGEVLRSFESQHAAAQWLVDHGLAKNMNCVSSINSVCQRKPCTTGYGYRKKAYGYDWQYADLKNEKHNQNEEALNKENQ